MKKNNHIVICHFIRNGYIIGIYNTQKEAEQKLNEILNLRVKVTSEILNSLLLKMSIQYFKINNKSRYEFGNFSHTTDGKLTIGICHPKIKQDIYIEQYILKNEFPKTLFEIDVLDKMEDEVEDFKYNITILGKYKNKTHKMFTFQEIE